MSPKRASGSLGKPLPGSKGAGDVDKISREACQDSICVSSGRGQS